MVRVGSHGTWLWQKGAEEWRRTVSPWKGRDWILQYPEEEESKARGGRAVREGWEAGRRAWKVRSDL